MLIGTVLCHALCYECVNALRIDGESHCQTRPVLRRSPCLRHTSWSSVSSRPSIPTRRTSTWRFSTHVVTPAPRPYSLPTCCVEDAQKNDNTVLNHGHVVIIWQSEARSWTISLLFFALVGLRAAEMTALPRSIIQDAKAISSRVSQQLLVGFLWCQGADIPLKYTDSSPSL